jgi:hypothetical protein
LGLGGLLLFGRVGCDGRLAGLFLGLFLGLCGEALVLGRLGLGVGGGFGGVGGLAGGGWVGGGGGVGEL